MASIIDEADVFPFPGRPAVHRAKRKESEERDLDDT
jgi:hypothetical protein